VIAFILIGFGLALHLALIGHAWYHHRQLWVSLGNPSIFHPLGKSENRELTLKQFLDGKHYIASDDPLLIRLCKLYQIYKNCSGLFIIVIVVALLIYGLSIMDRSSVHGY
jgi:hypothetical protein